MENKVIFRNRGLLDIRGITTFGVSAKGDNKSPIGQFGTGLKYAIAVCLRNNQKITVWIGMIEYTFELKPDDVRGKSFNFIQMTGINRTDDSIHTILDLPFTTDLGKNWELWMAFRELYSNTIDEGGDVFPDNMDPTPIEDVTQIIVEGDEMVQVLIEKSDVFLSSKAVKTVDGDLDIHEGESNAVFNKGIRVAAFEKPLLHSYDMTGYAYLTEDRTLYSTSSFTDKLVKGIVASNDSELIEKIVTAPETHYESTLNFIGRDSASDTFLSVVKRLIKKSKDKVNPTVIRMYENLVKATRALKKKRDGKFTIVVTLPEGIDMEAMADIIEKALKEYHPDLSYEDQPDDIPF